MVTLNRQYRLAARPVGLPSRTDWTFGEEAVRDPADGEVLVKVLYVSLDPAMRGWISDAPSYIPPVAIGAVMRAGGVGRVVASRHPKHSVGEHLVGTFGVQEYALASEGLRRVDPAAAPLPTYLGALGMPGMTAYFGLLDTGKPKPGDTVVVSAAAGAVGSVAGQIAKIKGCRAVGIAGGEAKCDYVVRELGFDACIDYKAGDVRRGLKQHCPSGIDVYFDNVGGAILDDALACLAMHARIVICGAISQYNATAAVKGPANYLALLVKRASMTGTLILDYADRYGEAARELGAWFASGKLKAREDVVTGLDNFPEALLMLFSGENTGKLVLKIAD
ncbi:MAG TPA: NADP-dependent oxidoreductase [Casimicrobiaceae bacterium]|nr:NADP-dependent oxidoreductase [Casimicrobiaceae bacterium]